MVPRGYAPLGSFAVLAVSAMAVGLTVGPLIERGLLRCMYGKDEIVLVLVTYCAVPDPRRPRSS